VCRRRPLTLALALGLLPLAARGGESPEGSSEPNEGEGTDAEQSARMHDPLQPPGYQDPARSASSASEDRFDPGAWRLVTTMVSGERRAAIINGRNVREGGSVGGATVLEIRNGRAQLDYRGRHFTIRTQTSSVRQRERSGDAGQ